MEEFNASDAYKLAFDNTCDGKLLNDIYSAIKEKAKSGNFSLDFEITSYNGKIGIREIIFCLTNKRYEVEYIAGNDKKDMLRISWACNI